MDARCTKRRTPRQTNNLIKRRKPSGRALDSGRNGEGCRVPTIGKKLYTARRCMLTGLGSRYSTPKVSNSTGKPSLPSMVTVPQMPQSNITEAGSADIVLRTHSSLALKGLEAVLKVTPYPLHALRFADPVIEQTTVPTPVLGATLLKAFVPKLNIVVPELR